MKGLFFTEENCRKIQKNMLTLLAGCLEEKKISVLVLCLTAGFFWRRILFVEGTK